MKSAYEVRSTKSFFNGKAILVAAILAFVCTDVCALSVQHQHHGVSSRSRWWTTQRQPMQGCRITVRGDNIFGITSKSIYTQSSCTGLASSTSSHLDISVTVETTVAVASTYSDGATASLSTTSSTASLSTPATASIATPTPETETAPSHDNDTKTVPMDTPARQSLPPHLTIRTMESKGMGVITLKPISQGEFVGEYNGEVMMEEVKDRRYLASLQDQQTDEDKQWIQSRLDRGQTLTGCYLYGVSTPPNYKGNGLPESRIYVDAEDEYESLWTRFLNHASPPYNNVNPKSIHESYDGNPRVWFVASRDIEEGEEICFDYGDDYWLEGDDVV